MWLYVVNHVSLSLNQYCHIQEYLQTKPQEMPSVHIWICMVGVKYKQNCTLRGFEKEN